MYALDITDGPRKGEQILVREGESVTIGRQRHTEFAISGDSTLSGTHCTVAVKHGVLVLTDEGSSNGTYVEGTRVHAERIRPGRSFRAGRSEFLVRFFPSFGSWMIPAIPPGWTELPGHGIQIAQTGRFPTNILFTEEHHPLDIPLPEYLRRQQLVAREALPRAEFQVPMPVNALGADEAYLARARFEAAGGVSAQQRQLYVSRLGIAGVVSMTTIDSECAHVDRMFDAIVAKARFVPRPPRH
ncbi:MAG: FHA domain-containing protein [Bryobacterales bacterium]|nr:FHA domain-containing protein [Bryobacterales bacterium]